MAVTATAGFCGSDIRGDCRVTAWFETRAAIEIRSRVQAFYGEAIRRQAKSVLQELGIEGCSLRIEDEGALPFTIGARIECALNRLGATKSRSAKGASRPQGQAVRSRRTRMYVPGNTPKFLINAGLYGADCVILDLEDSVPPGEKDAARLIVRNALREIDFGSAERLVRINRGPDGEADLTAIDGAGAQTLIVPKVEGAADLDDIDQRTDGRYWLIPLVETAAGVSNALEIARANERVVALSFGLEDYLLDIGATKSESGDETAWALAQIVNAARAAGVSPLGPVSANLEDADGLERSVRRLAGLGFDGFSCIHPSQVRLVHKAMMPSQEEIESAMRIVEAYRDGVVAGLGAVNLDGRMVDAPVAGRAQRTLRLAGRSLI